MPTNQEVAAAAKKTFDLLTPESQTSRLTFRRFQGFALAAAAESGGDIESRYVDTVRLKVNPASIGYAKPKIVNKVQTSKTGTFVIMDWGTDLLSMTIYGNTGNMLPGIIQSGFNPWKTITDNVAQKLRLGSEAKNAVSDIAPYAQNILIGTLQYHELLEMSPKYRTFRRLQQIYDIIDADQDVLTLEMADQVYRGYFTDFSFDQTADSPWNWKYNLGFVSLVNLSEYVRRGDDNFSMNRSNVDLSQ